MNSKKHLRKIRHNYLLLLLLLTFRPPFPCKFSLFCPNGMFIARHLRHLLVTAFVKNTPTTVINMIRITFTVLLFRVIVKEVILKALPQIQSRGEERNRIYSFPTKINLRPFCWFILCEVPPRKMCTFGYFDGTNRITWKGIQLRSPTPIMAPDRILSSRRLWPLKVVMQRLALL